MPHLRVAARRARRRASGLAEAAPAASIVGWSGSSAQAKCDQMPTTRTAPSASRRRAAATSVGPVVADAPLRARPVSTLRWTRAGRPSRRAAAAISSSAQSAETDRSTSAASAAAKSLPGTCSQRQHRAGVSRPPAAPAPRRAGPRRARSAPPGTGGAGARHQPVAVAVGLDHGHHARPTRRAPASARDVVADRVEVDDGARRHPAAAGSGRGRRRVRQACRSSAPVSQERCAPARQEPRHDRRYGVRHTPAPAPGPPGLAASPARPCTSAADAAGVERRQPGGEQRADEAGEHVAGAGGGQPRRRVGLGAHQPRRSGVDDERGRALEQDRGAGSSASRRACRSRARR